MLKSAYLIQSGLLTMAMIFTGTVQAQQLQQSRSQLYYVSAGFGRDFVHEDSWFSNLGLSTIFRNGWGGSFQVRFGNFGAVKTPADYDPGFIILGSGAPLPDRYRTYAVHAIREFFGRQQRTRFGVEAGPAIMVYYQQQFTPYVAPPTTGSGIGIGLNLGTRNYDYAEKKYLGYGLSLKAKAGLPLGRRIGFEVDAFTNINTQASLAGLELVMNIGKVRNALAAKHP